MTLQEGSQGGLYRVKQIDLPLNLERRLEALGLTGGSKIDVLRKKRKGAMIIRVRGTRFAVGHGIAAQIEIQPETAE